jgi:hypothetical protein
MDDYSMNKKKSLLLLALPLYLFAAAFSANAAPISLNTIGDDHFENFNDLANSGSSSVLPPGWDFSEAGSLANILYAANGGNSDTPNTYSYGNDDGTERGLGSLNGASFETMFGAEFPTEVKFGGWERSNLPID